MSSDLYWLQKQENWTESLKSLTSSSSPALDDFVALAQCNIDFLQTVKLDRAFSKAFAVPPIEAGLDVVKLAILSSSTTNHLPAAIRIAGLRSRQWIDIYICEYGQYMQDLQTPDSAFSRFRPDAVLFALDVKSTLGNGTPSADAHEAVEIIDAAMERLERMWQYARKVCHGPIIQQTFLNTALPLAGSNEHRLPGSLYSLTQRLNERLRTSSDSAGVDLLAIDTYVAMQGLANWHSPQLWHRAKQEISPAAAPAYAHLLLRLLIARKGKSAKCLVLDLDNTLWGGVIGDAGVDGIVLGQGSALGEAYIAFQQYVKGLAQRGIILAVCSKNDEKNAIEAFERHPEMVLRTGDIACFVANWQDKPGNLRYIAKALNIGLDALVFADDNPFERTIVRRELPMVAVPELPEDPTLYAQCISDAGYFEASTLTADDLARGQQYQNNLRREALLASSTDLQGYLRSLDMRLIWQRFDASGRQRITQLINKTNQFNLTTRRYTEADVTQFMDDPETLTLQLRLVDVLGDNGIIGIIIACPVPGNEKTLRIDTWLMSCRVLGRQVEEASLNLLVEQAKVMGIEMLIGEYRPTAKNGMVSEHYSKLGFEKQEQKDEGETSWLLSLPTYSPKETCIKTEMANT